VVAHDARPRHTRRNGVTIYATGNVYVANYNTTYSASEFAPAAPLSAVRILAAGNYVGDVGTDQLQNAYVASTGSGTLNVYPPGNSTTPINQWAIPGAWSLQVWP
jgi:hypothetical protein